MEKDKLISSNINNGVILNAYPDSIGENLSGLLSVLNSSDFDDVFSLFYALPTFFNSDLDRGFSIIDYNINKDLISIEDLDTLNKRNIQLKLDIVLNHLSVASPQFKDLIKNGEDSKFKNFFIDWNEFWINNGNKKEDGILIPKYEFLDKLFMRKPGLPILKIPFPDGSVKPYWNTFYQKVTYQKLIIENLKSIEGLSAKKASFICRVINEKIIKDKDLTNIELKDCAVYKKDIFKIMTQKQMFLGQMDLNAKSPLVWKFYEDTLKKVSDYGCKILRLDAFAYLHKEVGQTNFFNEPGTWDYLNRLNKIAQQNDLMILPEIHSEYGSGLYRKIASEKYYFYDFFSPGLILHTIENQTNVALVKWIKEIIKNDYKTVNMLGCHDGIPVLDLKGKEANGIYNKGLLTDNEIDELMSKILERGGRMKNIFDANGNKISYYQINATYFSALGESEQKLLVARAIQLFMPGIPQVWYLDLFAGKNDYKAADSAGKDGHKEINRTNLTVQEIEKQLKKSVVINQLILIKLRNTSKAFLGKTRVYSTSEDELKMIWTHHKDTAQLSVNLSSLSIKIEYTKDGKIEVLNF